MAKETKEQNQVSQETQSPVTLLTESLRALLQQGTIAISIEGEEKPYELIDGDFTNVRVSSAWIGFTHKGCAFRTKDPEDRDVFLALLEKGYGDARNIRFIKHGVLIRPAVAEKEKKKHPFIPRGRYAYGRPKLVSVPDQYALTED